MHGNNFRRIEELYPLSKVSNKETLDSLQKDGWSIDLTSEMFKEKFPGVPVENVYFLDNALSSYYYMDLSTYFIMDLQIHGGQSIHEVLSDTGETLFEVWQYVSQKNKSTFESGDFSELFIMTPSPLNSSLLNYILEQEKPSEKLYELFISIYTFNDYGAGLLSELAWSNIMKSFEQSKDFHKELSSTLATLPETVTVYRGEGDKSTPYQKAPSWTLSPNVALFFALRLQEQGQEKSRFIQATVKKDDILAYIQDREEEEILIKPGAIELVKCIDFYTIEEIADTVIEANDLYFPFQAEVQSLFKQGMAHEEAMHKLRVGRYVTILAQLEGLDFEETSLILGVILKSNQDFSQSNDKISLWFNQALAKSNGQIIKPIPELEEFYYRLMVIILRDAIELDRLRFGTSEIDLLQLQLKSSWELLPFVNLSVKYLKLN